MVKSDRFIEQERFIDAARKAAYAQMNYLVGYQQDHASIETRLKEDSTIQTEPDVESDRMGLARMQEAFPLDTFWGEESGFTPKGREAEYTDLQDGLDGTTAFKQGLPTFCVAWGRHHNDSRSLVAAVARNATGQTLTYDRGAGTQLLREEIADGDIVERLIPLYADPVKDLSKEGVFVDISRAFTRTLITSGEKRVVMTPAQKEYFMSELQRNVKGIQIPGSNILQQMATAMRRNGAAGYFMTAAGGPQDAIGVGFILGAGGAARAFDRIDGHLTEVDPLNIFGRDGNGYDLLVGARDAKTAGKLVDILAGAYKR